MVTASKEIMPSMTNSYFPLYIQVNGSSVEDRLRQLFDGNSQTSNSAYNDKQVIYCHSNYILGMGLYYYCVYNMLHCTVCAWVMVSYVILLCQKS